MRCGADSQRGFFGEFFLGHAINLADAGGGEFRGRAIKHHPPGIQRDNAVAVIPRCGQVMQIDQHSQAIAVHIAQRIHHNFRITRVERGNRLIGQDQARILHQRARNRDPLLLATRKCVRALQRGLGQVKPIKRGQRHGAFFGGEHLEHGRQHGALIEPPDQHIGQHIKPLHQVELLEDHGGTHAPIAQSPALQLRHILAIEDDAPFAGLCQAVDHTQQRGFTRA